MSGNAFWVIWTQDGQTPIFCHTTEQAARNEAVRLAQKQPHTAFYVLQAIACYEVTLPVALTELIRKPLKGD
jgi:hypothetical protein